MNYNSLVERLRNRGDAVAIGIFRPANSSLETTCPGYYDRLKHAFEQLPDARVEWLDEECLISFALICGRLFDVIAVPEFEHLPRYEVPVAPEFRYSPPLPLTKLMRYLKQHGALIISSADFALEHCGYADAMREQQFRLNTGVLGIKPYKSEIAPDHVEIDTDFLPSIPQNPPAKIPPAGLYLNTSSNRFPPEPQAGNIFPERYPALRNHVAVRGVDAAGRPINSAVVFAQNWEDGYRLVAVASNTGESFINPANPHFDAFIQDATRFCLNQIIVSDVRPDRACYRKGERIAVSYRINNYDTRAHRLQIHLLARGENGDLLEAEKATDIRPSNSHDDTWEFGTASLLSDVYEVEVRVSLGGRLLSKGTNGFVIWNPEVIANGPRPQVAGQYLSLSDKPSFVTGTNYYESHLGELMWVKPDIARLNSDLKAMAQSGINWIRIHYHHPKWFHDYLDYRLNEKPSYHADICRDPLPDEAMLRVIDAHVYLCQKHGIVYAGDWFTLVPAEMGDPSGWMFFPIGPQDIAILQSCAAMQAEFVKLLVQRYRDVPGISWDVVNELSQFEKTRLHDWASGVINTFRKHGDTHLIHLGLHNSKDHEDTVDFHAVHMNFREIGTNRIATQKPQFCQEVWMDRPPTQAGNLAQEQDLRLALVTAVANGFCGFAPWQWTNQARLWNDYRVTGCEVWDDRLGLCVRDDGTEKPAGNFYRKFARWIAGIEFIRHRDDSIATRRGTLRWNIPDTTSPKSDLLLAEYAGANLRRALAPGRVLINGAPFIEANGDIFVLSEHALGPDSTSPLSVAVTKPGPLRLHLKNQPAQITASLVPGHPGFPIAATYTGEHLTLDIPAWLTAYWINLRHAE
jgi:hypothetical protein